MLKTAPIAESNLTAYLFLASELWNIDVELLHEFQQRNLGGRARHDTLAILHEHIRRRVDHNVRHQPST